MRCYGDGSGGCRLWHDPWGDESRYMELGSLFEFYDEHGVTRPDKLPRKGRTYPSSPYHQAIHDYGWTSTLYTDLVYSSMKGKA
jgi:hypothetical protein